MFQRKPINAAVTVAIGAMVAASAAVQADSILFPHVVSSPDVTTIVSVINTCDEDRCKDGGDVSLHYQLVYKNWETAGNAGVCDEINYFLPTSPYDIQTIDLGAEEAPGVLFEPQPHYGKPSLNVWYDEGNMYNMATVAKESATPAITALRGYLLVDNNDKATDKSVGPTLFGEGLVLEYQTGSAWGYPAPVVDEAVVDEEFDYGAYASASGWPVAIMPLGGAAAQNATTAFMVTPVLASAAITRPSSMDTPNATTGKFQYTAWVALSATGSSESPYVGFDRDENILSGSTPKSVTCVGRVDAKSLTNNLVPLTDGGWSHLINYAAGGTGTYISNSQILTSASAKEYDAAIIYKLDYGTGFGDYPMADGTGSFDSAIVIPPHSFGAM